jgi:hypothetical protein
MLTPQVVSQVGALIRPRVCHSVPNHETPIVGHFFLGITVGWLVARFHEDSPRYFPSYVNPNAPQPRLPCDSVINWLVLYYPRRNMCLSKRQSEDDLNTCPKFSDVCFIDT